MPVTSAVHRSRHRTEHLALSAIRVRRLLSTTLFHEMLVDGEPGAPTSLAQACHARWTDLAAALCTLDAPAEGVLVVAHGLWPASRDGAMPFVGLVAVGRGATDGEAEAARERAHETLWTLASTTLDFLQLEGVRDAELLDEVAGLLRAPHVTELRRRREPMRVHEVEGGAAFGFLGERAGGGEAAERPEWPSLVHLFPWVPSDDPWRRLMEALDDAPGPAGFLVHFAGLREAPQAAWEEARAALVAAERAAQGAPWERHPVDAVLQQQIEHLRRAALERVAVVEGAVVAARVFVAATAEPGDALLATCVTSVDDASMHPGLVRAPDLFRGGVQTRPGAPGDVLAPLDAPGLAELFGPVEAAAVLRTPMPAPADLAGLPVTRARTARLTGGSGDGTPLGLNVHRGRQAPVALEDAMRFRHTYVVGQTGTGKSTLLLHMALRDIREGHGVAVLDPHGPLIDALLERLPPERVDDVVLVDLTDVERPLPFNPLRIGAPDAAAYQAGRDLVIDDLESYLKKTYPPEMMGPIFESHFRASLALLLGLEPPTPPLVPSLLIVPMLYSREPLRKALRSRVAGRDLMLDVFLDQLDAVTTFNDQSYQNIAPYITSKFNRFVGDLALRNLTCQQQTLDFDAILRERRILLFYLGKGRFGDIPAGLLAGQVISRIRAAAMRRGARDDAPPFFVYADEFQLFADHRFAELLAEARKFRVSLTLAHQYLAQLDAGVLESVLGNVGTTIAFRVGAPDAERLEPSFVPRFRAVDLASQPNFQAYVRSFGQLGDMPFSLETAPPGPGADPAVAALARQRSRARWGRDRADVEAEIRATWEAYRALR